MFKIEPKYKDIIFDKEIVEKRFHPDLKTFLELDIFSLVKSNKMDFFFDKITRSWERPSNTNKIFLAGGALRHIFSKDLKEKISDFDVFVSSATIWEKAYNFLEKKALLIPELSQYPDVKTFKYKNIIVQLCGVFFINSFQDIKKNFPYQLTMMAFNGKELFVSSGAIRDIRRKKMTLVNVIHPVAEMRYLQKYIKRGYIADDNSFDNFVRTIYQKGWQHALHEMGVGNYGNENNPCANPELLARIYPYNIGPVITDLDKDKDEDFEFFDQLLTQQKNP